MEVGREDEREEIKAREVEVGNDPGLLDGMDEVVEELTALLTPLRPGGSGLMVIPVTQWETSQATLRKKLTLPLRRKILTNRKNQRSSQSYISVKLAASKSITQEEIIPAIV